MGGHNSTHVFSRIGRLGQEISRKHNQDYDKLIQTNLKRLTCDNIRELYYGKFNEEKEWSSSSGGITGFSETLIFSVVRHTLVSMGEEFIPQKRGPKATDPIIFVSKNYKIQRAVNIKEQRKSPDISIYHNGLLFGIIQIKIILNRDPGGEVKTMKLFREDYPKIKGLFIDYTKDNVEKYKPRLEKAGFQFISLEGNPEIMYDRFKKFMLG